KKEIEIKHLRDTYKIAIYGSKTKIHISDCSNGKNAKNSSNEYGTTFLKNKKSTLSLNEFNDKDPEELLNEFNDEDFDHDHSSKYGTTILNSSLNVFNDEDFEEQPSLLSQILIKFNNKDSEEHKIYLKLIFELQNCELLKPTKNSLNFSLENDKYKKVANKLREKINTLVNNIIELNVDKESNIENKESNIEMIKQNLVDWLTNIISLERTRRLKKKSGAKNFQGYISYLISSTIKISEKYKRNIWNSLNLLIALLLNGVNYESLIETGATAKFFLKIPEYVRQEFYKKVTQNENYEPKS
ncbi:6848_t:CDS:2, partial [Racocetra persica]